MLLDLTGDVFENRARAGVRNLSKLIICLWLRLAVSGSNKCKYLAAFQASCKLRNASIAKATLHRSYSTHNILWHTL